MNTVELLQFAQGNALRILKQVTEDLSQEQTDWTPPGVVNSIGSIYWHVISGVDQVVHGWGMGQETLLQKEGWQEKVIVEALEEEKAHPAQMMAVRVDLPTMHEYSQAVARAARDWLAALTPDDLERQINTPVGEMSLGQVVEVFVVWHVNAHCGEIAALKGCQGAKGYPF